MLGRVITGTIPQSKTGKSESQGNSEDDSSSSSSSDRQNEEDLKRRAKLGMVVDMAESSWVGGLIPNPTQMPLYAGYAESINAGKTRQNEDQGSAKILSLVQASSLDYSSRKGRGQTKGFSITTQRFPGNSLRSLEPERKFLMAGLWLRCASRSVAIALPSEISSRALTSEASYPGQKRLWKIPKETPLVGRKSSTRKRADSECQVTETERINDPESGGEMGSSGGRRLSDDDFLLHVSCESQENGKKEESERIEASYFGVYDGHAGTGAALMAANCLHEHVRERLSQVMDTILHLDRQEQLVGYWSGAPGVSTPSGKTLTRDSLVIGALETAFVEMDEQISEEKLLWRIPGGCACVVALFLLGKIYVGNAGDCRALLVSGDKIQQLSQDYTPDVERKRLQYLAYRQPDLLGKHFTRLEYSRHLFRKDIRKKVLYRDWYMDGWAQKTVRDTDIRPPLISDCLRKCRLLNTIGVTRGFGDHHLMTLDDHIPIKPFLTPVPEVRVLDMTSLDSMTERDVLVLASDGLWDVLSNEEVANILQSSLSQAPNGDVTMYTLAAQDLVIAARGDREGSGRWELSGGRGHASTDDITVFVIPLKYALAPPKKDDDVELLQ